MIKTKLCPKCGSRDLDLNAKVLDRSKNSDLNFQVATYEKPSAIIFQGRRDADVRVCVCLSCGYLEFYAIEPALLKTGAK